MRDFAVAKCVFKKYFVRYSYSAAFSKMLANSDNRLAKEGGQHGKCRDCEVMFAAQPQCYLIEDIL